MAAGAALALLAAPAALGAFQDQEPKNFAKTDERWEHLTGKPEYQALLRQKGLEENVKLLELRVKDPERNPHNNLCARHQDGCAGDVRFYDWNRDPGNVREPVLWTARSGATISGHVWAVRQGPARRPAVLITNGSVQAPEQLYWPIAAALARAGYVVLTWDPQTQGLSDGPGEPPTENENSRPQSTESFTEGTVDAIDFFLSTPARPFRPRNSRTRPDVNHSAKQERRVAEGRNAAYNPLHATLNPRRLGIAGHSLGALGVSKVASEDRRVDAVVAWDNLRVSESISGQGARLAPRVPALGMSGDYGTCCGGAAGVTPRPRPGPPDPQAANGASREFSKAGIPTAQLNTRGGTHFEPSVIPNRGFGATLRGLDQQAWYTLAWFQRYLKRDRLADRMLLTDRWQRDEQEAAVDPDRDGNHFSRDLRSRLDLRRLDGTRAQCEDVRSGCGILAPDGLTAGPFSVLDYAYGRQRLRRAKPRCASAVRAPRRLDLSRSRRHLRLRLRLDSRTRSRAALRRLRRARRLGRARRTLRPGRRTLVVRVSRRAAPGRYRVTLRLRCAGARQVVRRRTRLVR